MEINIPKLQLKKLSFAKIGLFFVKIGSKTGAQFLALFAILIILNLISQQAFIRIDLTENKVFTLSEGTKSIIQNIDEKVTITTYFSDNVPPEVLQTIRNTHDLFSEYERFSNGKVDFQIKNPQDDDFKTKAQEAGIPEVQYSELAEDKYEVAQGFLGAAVTYKEKTEAVELITPDNFSSIEYETSSRIYNLTTDTKPKIGFLSGHGEKSITTELSLINEVIKRQFETEEVNFSDGKPLDPEKTKVLVIVSPTEPLSQRDLFEIDQYTLKGGRVLVLSDLYTLGTQSPTLEKSKSNINKLLAPYGAKVESKILLDESFSPIVSGFQQISYPFWVLAQNENMDRSNPALVNLESAVFYWANPITNQSAGDQQFIELINSTDKAWTREGASVLVEAKDFNPTNQQQYTLAAMISGKQESIFKGKDIPQLSGKNAKDKRTSRDKRVDITDDVKVIVIGDADFITDQLIQNSEQNAILFLNLVEYLASSDDLINIRSKAYQERPLRAISTSERNLVKGFNVAIIPILLVPAGLAYNAWRRKRESRI